MEKKKKLLWGGLLLFIFAFYVHDKPIIRGGSMVGEIRVRGTANKKVKEDLKSVLRNVDYYVVNLSQATSDYLVNMPLLEDNYDNQKKYVMYPSIFNEGIDCPYGRAFQKALHEAKSNETNKRFFDFYIIPNLRPYASQKDLERMRSINAKLPENIITEEEAEIELDFYNTCSSFCVINPKTNHLISFSAVGQEEANQLQKLLDYLKRYDW